MPDGTYRSKHQIRRGVHARDDLSRDGIDQTRKCHSEGIERDPICGMDNQSRAFLIASL